MMQQQTHFDAEESFLGQFLKTQPEQFQLLSGHSQRRAEDILQGLCHMLQLAHAPYHALHQANVEALTDEERARYRLAYDNFRQDLAQHDRAAATPGQTSGAAPRSS